MNEWRGRRGAEVRKEKDKWIIEEGGDGSRIYLSIHRIGEKQGVKEKNRGDWKDEKNVHIEGHMVETKELIF